MNMDKESGKFYSGFVSLVGRPNVGKSTLMNTLVGEKIAIVSHKPQTTRNKITAVLTKDDFQAVFIDTPGIHKPKNRLGAFMLKSAETALDEVDICVALVQPGISERDKPVLERVARVKSPVFLVINKVDTVERPALLPLTDHYRNILPFAEIIPLSARTGENTDRLLERIRHYLPEGPRYFPDDMITDQPERAIVSELIREKALLALAEEIPHGVAVEILSMKKRERSETVDIEASVYVERDSHKAIVIG